MNMVSFEWRHRDGELWYIYRKLLSLVAGNEVGGKAGEAGWRWSMAGVNGRGGARALPWRQGQPLHGCPHMSPCFSPLTLWGCRGTSTGAVTSVCATD